MLPTIPGYKISEKISEGHRTVIYRAIREDGRPVILKTIKSEYPTHRDLFRIRHEYKILKELNISGIPRAYGLEKHNNGFALVLESFKGKSLREVIKTKVFSIIEFLHITIKLSEIVSKIHNANISHKDINPRNIVIDSDMHSRDIDVNIIVLDCLHY